MAETTDIAITGIDYEGVEPNVRQDLHRIPLVLSGTPSERWGKSFIQNRSARINRSYINHFAVEGDRAFVLSNTKRAAENLTVMADLVILPRLKPVGF